MFYTYILKSGLNGKYYIGSTNNIKSRIERHNNGYVRSTKPFRPWEIAYTEKYNTLVEARNRENIIKNWKSRESIEKLITAPFV